MPFKRLSNEMKIIISLFRKSKNSDDDFYERYVGYLENEEEIPVFEILNVDPRDYPPVESLKPRTIKRKLKRLERILLRNNFILELSEKLPAAEAYRYLTEFFLYEEEKALTGDWACHITGCGGYCPGCFQLNYCDLKDEIWTKEELDAELAKLRSSSSHSSSRYQ